MQAMQNPNLLLCTMLDSTFQPPAWGFCGAGVCNSQVHAAPPGGYGVWLFSPPAALPSLALSLLPARDLLEPVGCRAAGA